MPGPLYSREIHQRLVDSVEVGNPQEIAADGAGISKRTLSGWMARGRAADQRIGAALADLPAERVDAIEALPNTERDDVLLDLGDVADRDRNYWRLFRDLGHARGRDAEREMAIISEVAAGYNWKETRTETREAIGKDGKVQVLTTSITTERYERDWRAAAWKLEHSPHLRDLYSKATVSRMELTGAQGGPIQVDAPETTEDAVASIRREALRLIRPEPPEEAVEETG